MEGNNNNNNRNVCEVCGSSSDRCGRCGNMCGFGRNHILRWILGIIIITWIFCIGMKFGELKASLDRYSGFSYRTMPMMGGTIQAQAALAGGDGNVMFTQAVPATGAIKIIKSN